MSEEPILRPPTVSRCPKCGFAAGNGETCEACGTLLPVVQPHLVTGPRLAGASPIKREATGGWLAPVLLILVCISLVLGGLWYYFAPQIQELRRRTVITAKSKVPPAAVTVSPADHPAKAKDDPEKAKAPQVDAAPAEAALTPAPDRKPENAEMAAQAQALFSAVGQYLKRPAPEETQAAAPPEEKIAPQETPVPEESAPAEPPPVQVAVSPTPEPILPRTTVPSSDPKTPIMLSEESFATGRAPDTSKGSGLPSRSEMAGRLAEWQERLSLAPAPPKETAPQPGASAAIQNLNESNFGSVINAGGTPVVVDFWAPWCGPCRQLAPVMDRVAAGYGGRVRFARVNVDENKALARRYQVKVLPTLMVFRSGSAGRKVEGSMEDAELKNWIDSATK